jgi:hypothetical protein
VQRGSAHGVGTRGPTAAPGRPEDVADEVVGAILHAASCARGTDRGIAGRRRRAARSRSPGIGPLRNRGPTLHIPCRLVARAPRRRAGRGLGCSSRGPAPGRTRGAPGRRCGEASSPAPGDGSAVERWRRRRGAPSSWAPAAAQASDGVARRPQAPDMATQATRLTAMVTIGPARSFTRRTTDRATDVGSSQPRLGWVRAGRGRVAAGGGASRTGLCASSCRSPIAGCLSYALREALFSCTARSPPARRSRSVMDSPSFRAPLTRT